MAKVLITGGAGFIGSHLAERVLALGHEVRVLDDFSTGRRDNLRAVERHLEILSGDVRDAASLRRAAGGCELIFHLAAVVSVQRSVEDPAATLGVNLAGTVDVLMAARSCGARRVVFASSAAVYGTGQDGPKREHMQARPESPYGLEKLAGEHYMRIWHELHALETISLRYFNVFGPRQDPSSPYSGVISIFADRLSRGVAPTIFGDGEQTRDFVEVSNVVEANCGAGFSATPHGVFNVGCGVSTSLNALYAEMAAISNADVQPVYSAARPADIRHSQADISAARAQLSYEPRVTVRAGLERLLAARDSH